MKSASTSRTSAVRSVGKKNSPSNTRREQLALRVFHAAADRVPAYKDFLKKNRINAAKIKSFSDFQSVPTTSKAEYLRNYPLKSLCLDGTLVKPLVFTSTSGSTGEPFYFPRGRMLDEQYARFIDQYVGRGKSKNTLVIVGFGMGVWIGGLITYQAFEIASREGHPVSIITPGINKAEIFSALRRLAPNFDRTILIGYPPFIKDIIDEASSEKVDLKSLNLRLIFAAEAFTEPFRDHLAEKAGIKNILLDTMNIYGSADIGAMAHETPLSILIRRLAVKDRQLFDRIFSGVKKTPTLAQYDPESIAFESSGQQVLLTGLNTIPLVRYAIGDRGGALSHSELLSILEEHGTDLHKEEERAGIAQFHTDEPFVYVYEREDFSIKLHLRDIYPELIRNVLISPAFSHLLTGKFTATTSYDSKNDQYLELHLELRKGRKATHSLEKTLVRNIIEALKTGTTGPGDPEAFAKRPGLVKPVFWPHEHAEYFKPGVKQKWVKK
jgi:phenylacetate-CoA ligase